jgi:hypothetical protein
MADSSLLRGALIILLVGPAAKCRAISRFALRETRGLPVEVVRAFRRCAYGTGSTILQDEKRAIARVFVMAYQEGNYKTSY